LSSLHLVISSLGVIAGIIVAVYQIMLPSASPPPVNVTVTVDPAKLQPPAAGMEVAKTESVNGGVKSDGLSPGARLDLSNAKFLSALNDGSDQKYPFRNLFDGKPGTGVVVADPDRELNILVDFGNAEALSVSAIAYTPPVSATGVRPATVLDVMVLPEGQIGAGGGKVYNFTLQTDQGTQSFALPPGSIGKGLWLRIAGAGDAGDLSIGDFAVLK
jgi:hypothetical protein